MSITNESLNKTTALLGVILLTTSIFAIGAVYAESHREENDAKKHAPVEIASEHNKIFYDFDDDGLNDYYFKIQRTGSSDRQFMADIKIRDTCVDGINHEEAKMKLGFTNLEFDYTKREWLTEEFYVSNNWFESNHSTDLNHKIDLVELPNGSVATPFPESGDDLIQKSLNSNDASFKHKNNVRELDGQAGWEGSIYFNGPEGEYFIWSIFPAEGSPNGEECDIVAALGVGINV